MKLWVCLTFLALSATCRFDSLVFPTLNGEHGRSFTGLSSSSGSVFCKAEDSVFMGFGSKQLHDSRNQDSLDDNSLKAPSRTISSTESDIEDALREIPSLPPPKVHDPSDPVHQLEVNGDSIAMTELGPIIVNADGTLRRIENWSKLTKREQANTIRLVTRRNKKRLEALKELQKEEEEQVVHETQHVDASKRESEL